MKNIGNPRFEIDINSNDIPVSVIKIIPDVPGEFYVSYHEKCNEVVDKVIVASTSNLISKWLYNEEYRQ